jgi:chromosome segregation ATPase
LGLVRLENKNAGAVRDQIIREKSQEVAGAEKGLGELAGAVRAQTKEVDRLEGEKRTLESRKAHFMAIVKRSPEGSGEAGNAKADALRFHRQLADVISDLNVSRKELASLTNEYEASKALIIQARGDIKEAKRKGDRLTRRQKTAARREKLVKTTSSLRGLGGVGDDLAELDEQIEEGINSLEGAAFVAGEMLADHMADRNLDIQIAQQDTDAAFEAELAGLEKVAVLPEPSKTIDVPAPDARAYADEQSHGGDDFSSSSSDSGDSSSD